MRNLIKYEKISFHWKNITNWLATLLSWVCSYHAPRPITGYKSKERGEIKHLNGIASDFDCYSLGHKSTNMR